MSALREKKKFKCKEHEDELLKYVCQDCRYTLVCSIGKNTRHRGHTLLDIKTAGVQIRQWFWEEIKVTNDCIKDTARALSKKRSFKANGNGSVQATMCDLQTNVQELKLKLDVFLQTQKGYAEQFAKIHSDEELPEDIETLEETLHSLQKYRRQMTKFSGESVPYVKLIQQFCMLEKSHNCRDEARERLSRMSRFNTLVFLLVPSDESPLEGPSERSHRQAHHPSNQSSDHWETFTRKMIGFPKMAQTADQNLTSGVGESKESYSIDMAMVHMLSLQLGDIVPILALHIADEDRIFIAHGEKSGPPLPVIPGGKMPTSSEDIIICYLNNNGTKLVPDRVFGGDGVFQPAITTTLPDKRVRLFCTQNGVSVKQDIFDLGTLFPRDQVHQEFFCAVKPSSSKRQPFPGRSQSYEIHKISSSTEEADELLFTVQFEDTPLRVVANRNLEAFAIILQQNSGSKKKKKTSVECPPEPQLYVRVYTKEDKDSAMPPDFKGMFGKEELKKAMVFGKGACDFHISDVCFYQKSNTTSPSQNGDEASQSGRRSRENGEMLIIATATALIVVDYENDCKLLDFFFMGYSLPDRRALFPTALTTDKDGQLWIGCRGGKVLCWKHIEDVMQSTYMEPATLGAAYDVDEDWPEGEFDDDDDDDDEGETSSIGSFTSDDRSLLGRARPYSDSIESGIFETGEAPADYYYVNAEDGIYELNFPPPRPPPPRPPRRPISNSSDSSSSTANSDPASLLRQQPEQTPAKPYLRPNKEPWNPPNVASPTSILPRQKQMTLQDELKLKVKQKQHQQQSRQLVEETQQSTREPFPSPKPERQPKTQHQEQQASAQQPVQQQQLPVQQQPQQPPVPQQQLSQQQQPSQQQPLQKQQQQQPLQQQQQPLHQPLQQQQQQDQQLQHLFHQQQQQLIWLQQQVQHMQQQQPQQQLQPLHHHQQQQQPSLSPPTAPRPADLPPSSPATGPAVAPSPSHQHAAQPAHPPPKIAPKPASAQKAASSAKDSISQNPTSPGPISSVPKGTATSPNWSRAKSSESGSSPRCPNQGGGQDLDNDPANMSVQQKAKYFREQLNKPRS